MDLNGNHPRCDCHECTQARAREVTFVPVYQPVPHTIGVSSQWRCQCGRTDLHNCVGLR